MPQRTNVTWLAGGGLVLVIAILLRLPGLGEGFWIDEVISVETARLALPDLIQRVGFLDVHPPLYYLLLSGYTEMLGEAEWVVRVLSLVLAVGSLALLFRWGWRRSPWTALASLLLMALSTFHAHYSIEARPYALLVLLTIAMVLAYERFLDAEETPPLGSLVLLLVETGLLMTHYCGAVLVLALNVHFFTCRKHSARKLVRWGTVQVASVGFYGGWLPLLLVQYLYLPAGTFAHLSNGGGLLRTLLPFSLAPVHPSTVAAWIGLVVLLAAAFVATIRAFLPSVRRQSAAMLAPPSAGSTLSLRLLVAFAAALLTCAASPVISVAAVKVSDTTLPLLLGVLPATYALCVASLGLIAVAGWFNLRLLPRGHNVQVEAFCMPLLVLGLAAVAVAGKGLQARNAIGLLPFLCILAAQCFTPRRLVSAAAWISLVVGVALPSLSRQYAAFEPRQDFRGAARVVESFSRLEAHGSSNFVLPMWDRPGIEYYLGKATANGLMTPAQMPPESLLPDGVNVVLTREAYENSGDYLSAFRAVLGQRFALTGATPLREVVVAHFQRISQGD